MVTAAYPTGGFFGYVLQTDGTGSGDRRDPRRLRRGVRPPAQRSRDAHIGQYVQVTGTVSEFGGLTELNVAAADVQDLGTPPLGGVTPLSIAYPTTDAGA